MARELTFSIIKPDAVACNHIGEIMARFEQQGLRIAAAKLIRLERQQVERLYAIHVGRPFFADLIQFMTSGPSVVIVLEGENAVQQNRDIMGITDPNAAATGTIRADFGTAVNRNAVHGSDSVENAHYEMYCVFTSEEIYSNLLIPLNELDSQSART
jgi:nucleoside-diphosphate kinase